MKSYDSSSPTIDTELDTILDQAVKPKLKQDVLNLLENADMNGYKRGYKEAEADYKVIIERETARARQEQSAHDEQLLRNTLSDHLNALTSPHERKDTK